MTICFSWNTESSFPVVIDSYTHTCTRIHAWWGLLRQWLIRVIIYGAALPRAERGLAEVCCLGSRWGTRAPEGSIAEKFDSLVYLSWQCSPEVSSSRGGAPRDIRQSAMLPHLWGVKLKLKQGSEVMPLKETYHRVEVSMLHCLHGSQPFLVIVPDIQL